MNDGDTGRIDELTRAAGRLLRAGDCQLALAHYLAVGAARGGVYMEGATTACAKLEQHFFALNYCLLYGRGTEAAAYLDGRPDLVLMAVEVESLVRGPGEGTRLDSEDENIQEVLFRLMHRCLYRGTEPDRRQRMAALLRSLPPDYGSTGRLSDELSDLIIDLRRYDLIIEVYEAMLVAGPPPDARWEDLFGRLQRAAAEEQDPELTLCTLLDDGPAFDARLRQIEVNARNVVLFAHSRRHYSRAVEFLLEQGDADRAAYVRLNQDDHAGAGKIYEQAGDPALAGRVYRDGLCFADALRCFEQSGDEAEIARIYERQHRYDEALAIWQRRGREQDVARVRNEMARHRADTV